MVCGWVWFQEQIPEKCVTKIGLCAQNMTIIFLGSIVNTNGGGGGPIRLFNEHENFHLDNEWDTHMSFKNNEECGYNLDLVMLIIMY